MMQGKRGAAVLEVILALLCLGLVLRPVDRQASEGFAAARESSSGWQVDMSGLMSYLQGLPAKIESKWQGLDRKFGYTRGTPVNVGALMERTAKHSLPLVTAGFVDSNGVVTVNTDQSMDNFERGMQGVALAFFDAAREGMR
jgi:hypothetical protein